jgi:hypothetical protein
MTTLELYRKHKSGDISREKFLYEVRRDNNLPYITNLTSYTDAVQILKNKGIVTEETKESKADEAVKAEVKPKKATESKLKELHIDYANPYEYRHGLAHELDTIGEYTDEALEKAKTTVLKNLAKDANFYSSLLNQEKSPYAFKAPETDAPGMQAKADGYLKKELKKDEKANVKDNLGKKEEGTAKPKGVKVMPDKGVTGSEKTIKEGVEKSDWTVGEEIIGGKKHYFLYNQETGKRKGMYKSKEEAESNIKEGKEEINEEFKYFANYEDFEDTLFQLYPQVKADPEKYKTERNGEVSYSDGYVNWASWDPNRPNTPSGLPPGAVNMNNKMTHSDLIYPPGSRMDEGDGVANNKVDDMIKSGKIKPEEVKAAAEKAMKGDSTSLIALMTGIPGFKITEDTIEEGTPNKYISVEIEGNEQFPTLNKVLISDYLKTVIDPSEIESVDAFMDDEEGFDESSSYFFDNDEENTSEKDVEDWAKQEMSYYLFSKPDEFPGKGDMMEHHNDPNFPGGKKIYDMLDAVAEEWGKDSDLYNELEEAIVGWSDRNGELTPKGKIAIKALLSNWDVLEDYGHFLDDTSDDNLAPIDRMYNSDDWVQAQKDMNEADASDDLNPNELSDENTFEDLMKKYDWYYEMSDDPREYNDGNALDKQLKSLAKSIGIDRAVELFNQYAPSDRKVTTSFFQMNEDKHAKLKELLKTKIKEVISAAELIQAKQKGQIVKIPKSATTDIQSAERAKANYSIYE